jgi:16S rRNA (adenine1518-N6/adenine1519-N6)-dimethyltransferase
VKSDLLAFLAKIHAAPRKSLSQNFLVDSAVIGKMASLAEIGPGDWVLEIGAGAGAITQELLARGARVYAIEIDPLFAEHLERLQTPDRRLHVECADFLAFPLAKLRALSPLWKVVSNIPYQITAPILEVLCKSAGLFESATLIMQKEVGDRICAKPRTKWMGSLTIFVRFYTEFAGAFQISPASFYPKPDVESMALRLDFKHETPPIDPKVFFPIVRKAFQQRRKMLTTSLKTVCPNIGKALEMAGLSTKVRPEELSLEEWVLVVTKLASAL